MNFASWVILAIVVAAFAFAVKATFFKKNSHGGCCDTGDDVRSDDLDLSGLSCASSCGDCSACSSCASARNNLQAIYKPLQ